MYGYGYDLETSKIRKYNSGSHEFVLKVEFNKSLMKNYQDSFK
jgi:hypothetical protein